MRSIAGLCLALLSVCSAAAENPDPSPESVYRLKVELAEEIQAKVLDPILGPGKSHVFADFEPEVSREREDSDRHGSGRASKRHRGKNQYDSKGGTAAKPGAEPEGDIFKGFGFNAGGATATTVGLSSGSEVGSSETSQEQRAEQTREFDNQRQMFSLQLKGLRLLVIHEAGIAPDKLETARTLLLAAYAKDLKPTDLSFRPVVFARR